MANTTKTYRVAIGELTVGHSVRTTGDFVPEAPQWPSFLAHVRAGTIESVYVDKKIVDAAIKKYADIEKKRLAAENVPAITKRTIKRKIVIRKKVETNANENTLSEQAV